MDKLLVVWVNTELDRAKQLLGKNATAVLGSAEKYD